MNNIKDENRNVVDRVPPRAASVAPTADVEAPDVKAELWRDAIGWLKVILFAIAFALILTNFVIVNASVPTGSMNSTIRENDRIVAFRLSYTFSDPQVFDIIVFRGPAASTELYVKRIIGLPGDVVNIVNGRVYINGSTEPLRDDFVHGPIARNYGPFTVPDDHFFVLGDYRSNSVDSRHWGEEIRYGFSYIYRGNILGRAIFRYFPGFRSLTNT